LLTALAEVVLWAVILGGFDFGQGLQFEIHQSWFSDLGVSYHVGFYGFTFWLAGLAVVVMAAAIAYGFWVGRERLRAYMGLLLFLTGAAASGRRIRAVVMGAGSLDGHEDDGEDGHARRDRERIVAQVSGLQV
jgi:hypothetical protein